MALFDHCCVTKRLPNQVGGYPAHGLDAQEDGAPGLHAPEGGAHGLDAQEGGVPGLDAQEGGAPSLDAQEGGAPGLVAQEGGNVGHSKPELMNEQRFGAYFALEVIRSRDGGIQSADKELIAFLLNTSVRTVERIWATAQAQIERQEEVDVSNKKKGNVGRKKKDLDLPRVVMATSWLTPRGRL